MRVLYEVIVPSPVSQPIKICNATVAAGSADRFSREPVLRMIEAKRIYLNTSLKSMNPKQSAFEEFIYQISGTRHLANVSSARSGFGLAATSVADLWSDSMLRPCLSTPVPRTSPRPGSQNSATTCSRYRLTQKRHL
jgi:hypothetical protein